MIRKIRCSKIIYEIGGEDKFLFVEGWGISYNKAFKILKNNVIGNTNFIIKGIKDYIAIFSVNNSSILNDGEIQYTLEYKERDGENNE